MKPAFTKLESVRIDSFDGGLNTKNSPTNLPLNQSSDMMNVVFDDYGAITSRGGYDIAGYADTAAVGTGVHSYVNSSGTSRLVGGWGDSLYRLSGTTFVTIPSAQGIYTAGVNVEFKTVRNYLFASNGGAEPYKWNGTDFTRVLPSGVTQAVTHACNAAGTLSGTYEYVYWGVNSMGAQTDYGGISNSLTVTSGYLRVSNIPTAPASHGIETWHIGRNTAQGSGLFYLVTSVTNGVTSFTDVAADSTLLELAPTDQGYPRKFKYMIFHKGYLWGAGEPGNPSYLWFSNINQPCEFPTTNFIEVGFGDGMVITGLAIQNDLLIISKADTKAKTALWTLTISDSSGVASPDNWYLQKTNSLWGAESHRAMVNYSNVLGFLNRQGFFAFSGNDLILSTSDSGGNRLVVDSQSFDIEPDIFNFKTSLIQNASAIVFKNKIWISVSYGASATANNKIYQFDFVRASNDSRKMGAWAPFDAHAISQFVIHDGVLYGQAANTTGHLYQLDTGRIDNFNNTTATIFSYYTTGAIKGKKGHEDYVKDWMHLYVVVEATAATNLWISVFKDYSVTNSFLESASQAGSGTTSKVRLKFPLYPGLFGGSSKYIQIQFFNLLGQYFKIYSLEAVYKIRGLR